MMLSIVMSGYYFGIAAGIGTLAIGLSVVAYVIVKS